MGVVPIVACQLRLQKGLLHSRSALRPKGGRRSGLDVGRQLGFKSVRRSGAVRAQKEEKEKEEKSQEKLVKVQDKPSESWTSSIRRANVVSRIFVATFVWISLLFGISVANNEIGGGRPGRRGPRK